MMISNLKAKKMLLKKCSKYLAHMVSKLVETAPNSQSTLTVYKFSNVFPNKLLGFVPEGKVDFKIKLALRTTLFSKALYRIAPVEL